MAPVLNAAPGQKADEMTEAQLEALVAKENEEAEAAKKLSEAEAMEAAAAEKALKLKQDANAKVTEAKPITSDDRVPCNWTINATKTGIEAKNMKTGRVFVGTTAKFNETILRG